MVKFKEDKHNTLTRFLTQQSGKNNLSFSAKVFEGRPSVEVEFFIDRSAVKKESHGYVCGIKTTFLDSLFEIAPRI
eukprot:UN26634